VAHLEQLLAAGDPSWRKLIVFGSLYSMDGDVVSAISPSVTAPWTYIEEVHAVGM
jgi:5-aminolevulinate synthase